MNPVTKDFSRLLDGVSAGAWVALSHDEERVVAFGSDMHDVLVRARQDGESDPIVFRVPSATAALIL